MNSEKVRFLGNGLTAVFFPNGEQVPGLQKPWAELYAEFMESKGLDPSRLELEFPNGARSKFFKTDTGWNW